MVCNRCVMVVKQVLEDTSLHPLHIKLGEVELQEPDLDVTTLEKLKTSLLQLGFELIDDKKSRIIEQVKNLVIDLVHYKEDAPRIKHSEYISQHLHYDYSYLSNLFSEVEGITIEQYIISQKIERVKELLVYNELTLSEIAWQMGYSSVAHLSTQFKKVTGLTPSHFKEVKKHKRTALDEVGKKPAQD